MSLFVACRARNHRAIGRHEFETRRNVIQRRTLRAPNKVQQRVNTISDPCSGSHHGCAFSRDIPGQAKTRLKIVVCATVSRISTALLDQTSRCVGIEVAEKIVRFRHRRYRLIAEAKIESKPRSYSPIVLDEASILLQANVPDRTAQEKISGGRSAGEKELRGVSPAKPVT